MPDLPLRVTLPDGGVEGLLQGLNLGGAEGADLLALVIDASKKLNSKTRALVDQVASRPEPKVVKAVAQPTRNPTSSRQ